MKPDERVQWVYGAPDRDTLARRYEEWAPTYEDDLYGHYGRPRREPVVDILDAYGPRSGRVLDAGAGTGVLGHWLAAHGFDEIVGIDISPAMLAVAEQKKVYTALRVGVLGEPLDLPDDHFDTVVSVGVFTLGHVPCSAFGELIRVTRPGGHIIFTMHPDFAARDASKAAIDGFVAAGRWQQVEPPRPYVATPGEDEPTILETWTYRVLGGAR